MWNIQSNWIIRTLRLFFHYICSSSLFMAFFGIFYRVMSHVVMLSISLNDFCEKRNMRNNCFTWTTQTIFHWIFASIYIAAIFHIICLWISSLFSAIAEKFICFPYCANRTFRFYLLVCLLMYCRLLCNFCFRKSFVCEFFVLLRQATTLLSTNMFSEKNSRH